MRSLSLVTSLLLTATCAVTVRPVCRAWATSLASDGTLVEVEARPYKIRLWPSRGGLVPS